MIAIRHEQAVLVIMAYVVGFVTAFIAFGINKADEMTKVASIPTVNEVHTNQVNEALEDERVGSGANAAAVASAFYENGMLSAVSTNGPVVLSVDSNLMPDLASDPQFAHQGLHESPPQHVVSPTGDYVYFCEEYTTSGTCRSFVYDINQDIIIPVTFDGVQTEISLDDAGNARWEDGILRIADFTVIASNGTWDMSTN